MYIVQTFCRLITAVTAKLRVFMIRNLLKLEWRNPASLQSKSDYRFQLKNCYIQLHKIRYGSLTKVLLVRFLLANS